MSRPQGPRNKTKAVVRFETRGGQSVAIKDYSGRPWLTRRLFGRPSLRREARAYERLAGLDGIPRCHGFEGGDALVLGRVDGAPLPRAGRERVTHQTFEAAERLLAEIHRRGVAIADLHRSNLIVGPGDAVHFVDFALALVARDPSRPGPLVRAAMRLDRHALARMRAAALGTEPPQLDGWLGRAYRAGRRLKALRHRP